MTKKERDYTLAQLDTLIWEMPSSYYKNNDTTTKLIQAIVLIRTLLK